jgi:WD40 repeat protein
VLRFRQQLDRVRTLRFLSGNQLLVATGNRLIELSADDGAVRRDVSFSTAVATFVVMPDKSEALVCTSDGRIQRVCLPDLVITQERVVLDKPSNPTMAISPDGGLLAVGTSTPAGVRSLLVDPRTLEPLARLPEFDQQLRSLEFSPDGRYLAIAGKLIVLWDLALVRAELTRLDLGGMGGLTKD